MNDSVSAYREIVRLLSEARDADAHDRDRATQLREAARLVAERGLDEWEAEVRQMAELAGAA